MPSREDISHQLRLLDINRRNARLHQAQLRTLGVHAPPWITSGLEESRSSVKRIRRILDSWGTPTVPAPEDVADEWESKIGVER